MNSELRKQFKDKNEIIKRLYSYYESEKKSGLSYEKLNIILDRIKAIKQEQRIIINKIKSNIYKSISIKEFESFSMKYRKKEIEMRKELLKKEEERKEKERLFKDARIVFDGEYKLYFNNDSNVLKYPIDVYYLHKNRNYNYDYKIADILKRLDEMNGTKLYNRYMNDEFPVQYDLSKKYAFLNKNQNEQLKNLAYNNKKLHKNVTIKKDSLSTKIKKAALITALGTMATIGIFSLFSKNKNKNKNNEVNRTRVEQVSEDEILKSNETLSRVSNNITSSIKYENEEKIGSKLKEDIIKSHNNINNIEKNVYNDLKNTEVKENLDYSFDSICFNDLFKMDDVNLYYSSTDINYIGNTKFLSYKDGSYKMSLISIVYNGKVLDVIEYSEDSFKSIREYFINKYDDSIKIFVNFDIVDDNNNTIYKNVGWVNQDELINNNKVMIK